MLIMAGKREKRHECGGMVEFDVSKLFSFIEQQPRFEQHLKKGIKPFCQFNHMTMTSFANKNGEGKKVNHARKKKCIAKQFFTILLLFLR
jgi:hypothetical protein